MSRVRPVPVEVLVGGQWYAGTLRTCDVSGDGTTCTGVVSYEGPDCLVTGRFPASRLRSPAGGPPCPLLPEDGSAPS